MCFVLMLCENLYLVCFVYLSLVGWFFIAMRCKIYGLTVTLLDCWDHIPVHEMITECNLNEVICISIMYVVSLFDCTL